MSPLLGVTAGNKKVGYTPENDHEWGDDRQPLYLGAFKEALYFSPVVLGLVRPVLFAGADSQPSGQTKGDGPIPSRSIAGDSAHCQGDHCPNQDACYHTRTRIPIKSS